MADALELLGPPDVGDAEQDVLSAHVGELAEALDQLLRRDPTAGAARAVAALASLTALAACDDDSVSPSVSVEAAQFRRLIVADSGNFARVYGLADGVRAEVNDAMRSLRAELASAAREAKRASTKTSASAASTAGGAGASTSWGGDARAETSRAVHEADLVLSEFRQQLRTDLRTRASRGRVTPETVTLLRARLAQVRTDVLATLGDH